MQKTRSTRSIPKIPVIKSIEEPEIKVIEEIVVQPKIEKKVNPFMVNPFKVDKPKKKLSLRAILDKFAGKKRDDNALAQIYERFDGHIRKIRKRLKEKKTMEALLKKKKAPEPATAEIAFEEIMQLGGPALLIGEQPN